MKPRIIKIIIERQPENVWLATSKDLPGFTVEIADGVQIYDTARKLAVEILELDGERKKVDALTERFLALEEQSAPDIPVTRPPHW